MEASRRGFLGIFGAGVVAGPKLAAGIAQNVAESMPIPPSGFASAGSAVNPVSEGNWRLNHIARLKRIISGKDPYVAQEQVRHRLYMADNCERVRLDGLRSVSPGHKMRMLVDTARHRQERLRRAEAGFDLAQFLSGEE